MSAAAQHKGYESMAKRKQSNDQVAQEDAATTEVVQALPPAEASRLRRYEVKLQGLRPAIVEANTPDEAWMAFKAMNGITASVWVPEIVEVD